MGETIIAIVKGKKQAIEKVTDCLDREGIAYDNVFDLTYYANVNAVMTDTLVGVETQEQTLAAKTLNEIKGILVMPTGLK